MQSFEWYKLQDPKLFGPWAKKEKERKGCSKETSLRVKNQTEGLKSMNLEFRLSICLWD